MEIEGEVVSIDGFEGEDEDDGLLFDESIKKKLCDRKITRKDIRNLFENREDNFLEEKRLRHKTNPKTYWFISVTNKNRMLKVCFMSLDEGIKIKSAYVPNKEEKRIYNKFAK